MQVDVTTDDLIDAKHYISKTGLMVNGKLIWHNWRNPIAHAIARTYGEDFYASVSPDFITIARRGGRDQRIQTTGEVDVFIKEWENGVASPRTFCIQLLSPSQI